MAAISGASGFLVHTVGYGERGFSSYSLHSNVVRKMQAEPMTFPENRPNGYVSSSNVLFSVSKCKAVKSMNFPIASAPKREKDPKKRVVITGTGLVSAFGNEVDTFYNKLLEGESSISLVDRFDASDYPVKFGGQIHNFSSKDYIDSEIDCLIDDCWRYCLVAGKSALQDAFLAPQVIKKMDRSRIGVVVGSGIGGLKTLFNGIETIDKHGINAITQLDDEKIRKFSTPYWTTDFGSALLAADSGFTGPNYSISTACATSNFCISAAANHIKRGEANIMLAGGTEAPFVRSLMSGFVALQALSKRNDQPQKASRPWDKDRDGFVMAEGAAVLVMESLEHAMKRGAKILAEYLGGAITCDAHHMTSPHPDGLGVSICITKALEDAGVSPEEINYVNAHATSTHIGDLADILAMKKVFKDTSKIKMNATKSMIGHSLGASGALEAIATVKAINTGWIHPTINQDNLEPEVKIDTVPNVKKEHEIDVAITNSFGFGGHNSVIVLAPFKH